VHPAAVPAPKRPDEDRVSELASLLAAKQAETDAPAYGRSSFPRASFPRTGRDATTTTADDDALGSAGRSADKRVIPADVPDAPSPFTAALARMVAGDRDVRQAVEEALVRPGAARPGADAEPRPARPGRPAESAVPSPPAHQEEETVGDQVVAPPSTSTVQTLEVPTWAAEPEVAAPSHSSREEAIAEVLRSALAQGHSDEALAGILRKVLAGASPQTALTAPEPETAPAPTPQVVLEDNVLQDPPALPEPVVAEVAPAPVLPEIVTDVAAPEVVAPEPAVAEPVVAEVVAPEVVAPEPVAEYAPVEYAPVEYVTAEYAAAENPVTESPAPEVVVPEVVMPEPALAFEVSVPEAPMFSSPMFDAPVLEPRPATPAWTPAPAWVAAPAASMWGPPSMSATLWGEPAAPVVTSATPIWAEVSAAESSAAAAESSLFEERDELAVEVAAEDEVPAQPEVAVVEAEAAPEPVAEESVQEDIVEAVAEELAPVLARTASDPAPTMSFDSTSIMPPLSLLPPLPGSRGRGRPPVPPAPSRRATPVPPRGAPTSDVAPSAPTAEAAVAEPMTVEAAPAVSPAADDVWAAVAAPGEPWQSGSLATVTRLPVAPLMSGFELPEHLFEPAAPAEKAPEVTVEVAAETAAEAVATVAPGAVTSEAVASEGVASDLVAPAAIATGEVADRLVELGVPRSLLGATFADSVTELGTYAALTRALALRLPKAPELPTGAGEVMFVVGPGIETLRAAQSLAASLRLDPDRVQWATRGDLAGLAPESSRVTTVGAAINRREDAAVAGTVTIVAVDAPMRTDAYWTAQMMAIWTPVAVWAVVEATRKAEDLEPWIDALPQVDALIVQDTDLSADPAAVLRRVDAPVALIDGARATPHRWASLLCERLENPQT
jgi:hypothetical protein